jgi:homoisocitrate dehydrogenase
MKTEKTMTYQICILPGDGIGPEVIASTEQVLRALPLDLDFAYAEIGFGAYGRHGTPLPEATLEAIRASDAALFGAVTTPPSTPGYFSPVVRMRQSLDLYANIRPCQTMPHPSSRPDIDLVIVRENTEGLYSGRERTEDNGNRAVGERVITRQASERIIRKAFEIARAEDRSHVTVVHKANILRQTCGLFRAVALEIASEYPGIRMDEMLVDNCAMQLVRAPEQFEVIVTTNLFGDILSDIASVLVGGLGVAYSGNIGADIAVFEPVHGSAPDIAGQHKANPTATLLSAAMMLDYLGETESAIHLRSAVETCIVEGKVTPDLGGSLTTEEMTQQVIHHLQTITERNIS